MNYIYAFLISILFGFLIIFLIIILLNKILPYKPKNQKVMSDKQQTAVEWLESKISGFVNSMPIGNVIEVQKAFRKAKEMEKQQIIDANIVGMEFIPVDPNKYKSDAEQYYNETFKSNGK